MFIGIFRQQVYRHRRNEGPGKQVGGEHREDHGIGEGCKEKFRYAFQHGDRRKYDTDAERTDQRRHRDLMGPVQDRNRQRFPHRVIAMDILDFDGRIVDEHPDRKCQPAQRHDVDGLSGHVQRGDGSHDRQRNRSDHDQGAAP